MIDIIKNFFSGGAGNLVKSVGDAIDQVVTSDQERLELENESQRAEMTHKQEMRALDVRETELYLKDTDSARDSQARVQESENASWLAKNIQPIIALILIILTFSMFGRALFGGVAANSQESTITMMILGALSSIVTQIVSYFFGSSRDSGENARKQSFLVGNQNHLRKG